MKVLANLLAVAGFIFVSLVIISACCGCGNRVSVVEFGNQVKYIRIPNEQTIDSIDYGVNPSNSFVTVKWKLRETR